MKWCNRYACWCDEVQEIIEEAECDLDCENCQVCEKIKKEWES